MLLQLTYLKLQSNKCCLTKEISFFKLITKLGQCGPHNAPERLRFCFLFFKGVIMVRNRKRSSSQQNWSANNMLKAIEAVQNGMAWKTASKNFSVPRATLKRRVLNKNKDAVSNKKILGAKRSVFTPDQEKELVDHILKMEETFFGLTTKDIRYMAFSLAEKNKINHPFNKELGLAGEDWLSGFRKRHPELTLRKPEATSAARAQGFNKPNVEKFFQLLKSVMDRHNFPAHRIFNVDETGVTTVQTKSSKVLAQKGRRQVGSITSAERGQLSTAVICMSAGGNYVPPMLIFPRQRMKQELTDGAPPGTIFACNKSGWMQLEIFSSWFEHFINHTKPTAKDPVLLILDGHMTHTKNLAVIEKARDNNVTILCLPPHCSHKLQPLDRSFMFPLNTFYVSSIEKFLRNNPGRTVTQFQISKLFGEAYLRAATPTTAINGFRKCGICPYNPDVFTDADFAASEVTDQPLMQNSQQKVLDESAEISTEIESKRSSSSTLMFPNSPRFPQPCSSSMNTFPNCPPSPQPTSSCSGGTRSAFLVSPKDINPIPKSTHIRVQKRKRGRATILTDSPYKNELQKERDTKEEAEKQKLKRQDQKRLKQTCKNVFQSQIETEASTSKKKTKSLKKSKKLATNNHSSSDESGDPESDTDDAECLFCGDTYLRSRTGEGWVRCIQCLQWAHDQCAGVEENDEDYACDNCL